MGRNLGAVPPFWESPYLLRQMAAWIKMPLRMEVARPRPVGRSDFVLDGDPAPQSQKVAVRPMLSDRCLSCLSTPVCPDSPVLSCPVCIVSVLWADGFGYKLGSSTGCNLLLCSSGN